MSFKTYEEQRKRRLIAFSLFFLAYMPTLLWMWERWFSPNSYYGHGILIPFVTAFLIYQRKNVLKSLPIKPSRWGLNIFLFGINLYLFSALLQIYFSSGFSLLIVLYGLILYFYGDAFFQEIRFPLLFLIFMIPLPLVMVVNFSFILKLFAAKLATFSLNNMRIPTIQEGSLIKMRHAYVVVEDACSGLRSLISLMALGSLFGYQLKSSRTKKLILFVSAIPIAVITNAFRIVFLAIISEVWGTQYATGAIHNISGFLVFVLAFALLAGVKNILE